MTKNSCKKVADFQKKYLPLQARCSNALSKYNSIRRNCFIGTLNFATSSARQSTGMPHSVNCTLSRPSSLGRESYRIYTIGVDWGESCGWQCEGLEWRFQLGSTPSCKRTHLQNKPYIVRSQTKF